jgi:hypothetical protein
MSPVCGKQSMFLDSLVGDAAWQVKYALNRRDQPIPFDIIEENIRDDILSMASASRNVIGVVFPKDVGSEK